MQAETKPSIAIRLYRWLGETGIPEHFPAADLPPSGNLGPRIAAFRQHGAHYGLLKHASGIIDGRPVHQDALCGSPLVPSDDRAPLMQAGAVCPSVLQQIVKHESIPLPGLDRDSLLPARAERCIPLVLRSIRTLQMACHSLKSYCRCAETCFL